MKHSLDDLLVTVYRHYPRGVLRDDSRYATSEEHLRLVAARRNAGAEVTRWRAMLRRLREKFPDHGVHDLSVHLLTGEHDACYSGAISLPTAPGEHFHSVDFLVSFLVPCYVVYSARVVHDPERAAALRAAQEKAVCVAYEDTMHLLPAQVVVRAMAAADARVDLIARRRDVSFDPSAVEQPFVDWITREIETTFGSEPMPPDVGNVIVPDVATNTRQLGEVRLYDCLFSDGC